MSGVFPHRTQKKQIREIYPNRFRECRVPEVSLVESLIISTLSEILCSRIMFSVGKSSPFLLPALKKLELTHRGAIPPFSKTANYILQRQKCFFSDRAGWLLDDINCIKAEFKERILAENDKANSGYEPSAASKVCSSMASYGIQ